jgi:hypothetical protein
MTARSLAAISAACLLSGCANLGSLGEILGDVLAAPAGTGELHAEVQSVDTRQQQIVVATQDGQRGGVLYDQNTQVVYRNQSYPVSALERGDIVSMRVQQTQQGLYTDYILVQQSAQERTGTGTGASVTVQGRVGRIDQQQGWFELTSGATTIQVTLPFNPHPSDLDYFRRLRGGETVSVTGRWVTQTRLELERFH